MKNKEKYAKEILEIACSSLAFDKTTNKVVPCNSLCCSNCLFGHNCDEAIQECRESAYVEPPVDWSKVSVDTPILVRDSEFDGWSQRHFAKCDNGTVYAWSDGRTSWTAYGKLNAHKYAKLAEPNNT